MNQTELKSKLSRAFEFLKGELAQIRTGRASPSLVESIQIDAYDTKMSIKELGSISVPDSQNLLIIPWDKSLIGKISKAIRESDLKLNPVEDKEKLRVPLPPLTEERRKEFVKLVATKVEDCKSVMRNVRHEAMKDIDKDFSDKAIGEDEKFRRKEEVEKTVKEYVEQVDNMGEGKKEEVTRV